jgi:hypothetical protein
MHHKVTSNGVSTKRVTENAFYIFIINERLMIKICYNQERTCIFVINSQLFI